MQKQLRIALISDIHGNLPALQAVLEDIRHHNIETVYCLGDITGSSPFPNEVIKKLIEINAVCIIGNYDIKVLEFPKKKSKWEGIRQKEDNFAFKWNSENLSAESITFLKSLPDTKSISVNGNKILLTHAGPFSNEEILDENTPSERFKEIAASTAADIIAFGHTHKTFLRYESGKMLINPGSVGKFSEGQTKASYAIIEFSKNSITTAFENAGFDIEICVKKLRELDIPDDILDSYIASFNIAEKQNEQQQTSPANFDKKYAKNSLLAVMRFAEKYDYEPKHFHQVERLTLTLFEKLKPLHYLGEREKFLLQCAAILHDIGWIKGQAQHHKTAMEMILADMEIPFIANDRKIIAAVARYHRKSLPSQAHQLYSEFSSKEKKTVNILACLLRIADGLDRSHLNLIRDLNCSITDDKIVIGLVSEIDAEAELQAAVKKSDLMEMVFKKKVIFKIEK